MGFLSKIGSFFWGAEPELQLQRLDPATEQFLEYCFKVTYGLLAPQLAMLNLEPMKVPSSGTYVSKRSRGYIMGIVARVLGDFPDEQTFPVLPIVGETAFEFVYGTLSAQELLRQSFYEWRVRDPELVAGSRRGVEEAGQVLTGKNWPSVMGFFLLNNGLNEQDEVIPLT